MADWDWYRVECQGNPDTAAAMLLESFPQLANGRLMLRELEVHTLDGRVDPRRIHNGVALDGNDVREVLGLLLDGGSFRCDLESKIIVVISAGDALYVGVRPGAKVQIPDTPVLDIVRVGRPMAANAEHKTPYPPASNAFWQMVSRRAAQGEALVLLAQWAAGRGGERWYQVSRPEQVTLIRSQLIPRSIIAVFPASSFIEAASSGPLEVVGRNAEYGAVRWLVPTRNTLRLQTETVDDEADLLRKWSSPQSGALLFQWPEENANVMYAACPDSDGVVRINSRFD